MRKGTASEEIDSKIISSIVGPKAASAFIQNAATRKILSGREVLAGFDKAKVKDTIAEYGIHQLSVVNEGIYRHLEVEKGRFNTFSRLLFETPSLVGRKEFLNEVIQQLFDAAVYINKMGVQHICYSPDNILARVGDNKLVMLSHGSYYLNMSDQKSLYRDMTEYLAPEVLSGGNVDERSDVYSIGKFIEWLYSTSDMPIEYRRLVKKATSELPEDRYQSVIDMRSALKKLKNVRGSLTTFLIALAAALVIVGVYFGITPEPQEIEYVKPAPKQSIDDLLEDGFDNARLISCDIRAHIGVELII